MVAERAQRPSAQAMAFCREPSLPGNSTVVRMAELKRFKSEFREPSYVECFRDVRGSRPQMQNGRGGTTRPTWNSVLVTWLQSMTINGSIPFVGSRNPSRSGRLWNSTPFLAGRRLTRAGRIRRPCRHSEDIVPDTSVPTFRNRSSNCRSDEPVAARSCEFTDAFDRAAPVCGRVALDDDNDTRHALLEPHPELANSDLEFAKRNLVSPT